MASRFFLSRSKALTVTFNRSRSPSSSLIDASGSSHCSSALHSVGSSPVPPSNRVGSSFSNLFGFSKISPCRPHQVLYGGHKSAAALSCFEEAQIRGMKHEAEIAHPVLPQSTVAEKNAKMEGEVGDKVLKPNPLDGPNVISFSPLEGAIISGRTSALAKESLKIKRAEIMHKVTLALIPALLLVSKSSLTTSLLIFSVYWQIYGFLKEIFLDYVHHEVTRKWVLIYLKFLLLVQAKEYILMYNLV